MRVALAAGLAALLLSLVAASSTPSARGADELVFSGLGTWIDIYDGAVYAAPERTATRIAARGVRTVWVETANDRSSADVANAPRLVRLVDALHAAGVDVVAWYLPGLVNVSLDTRRALAMLSFRTPTGGAFDGVALDIESTRLANASLRSRRAVALAQRIRQTAPDEPFAIVPFNPRGLERHPHTWPKFPYAQLAATSDAFAPMIYTGSSMKGFDATYGYVTRALRLLRTQSGRPDLPIHVVGGVANRMSADDLAGFAAAVADDGGTMG
jgi:hypothetical protein